ncbi:MAG: efflux RND transporter periplasmic adaptor subunit [Myxococcales bacterium]|nr:efflux RND transporter periplasmic adaptor subunit [Myxococcales bacterium]
MRVEAGPPWVRDVEVTLPYPVELEADEAVSIMPVAISGRLQRVLVDVGDKVESGALVALVDCREYTAQRTQAQTSISRWEAQVDEARSRLDRLLAMDEGKLVAPAEIDRAQAEARIAEAQLEDARAKLAEASQRQGYCSLRAPFDGYVVKRTLDPGAMVRPGGAPILKIAKTRQVRAVASIVERDAPKVPVGAEVDVALNAFPDQILRAQVTRVGRSLDEETRTLRVEIDLPNTEADYLPGMTGRAAIVIGKRPNAVLVPVTAVSILEESAYVYVVDESTGKPRAKRAEVELGVDLGDWLEVLSGIEADQQVIMVGRELVTEGTWLEVKEAVIRPRATQKEAPSTKEPRSNEIEEDTAPAAATDGSGDTDTDGAAAETAPPAESAGEGEADGEGIPAEEAVEEPPAEDKAAKKRGGKAKKAKKDKGAEGDGKAAKGDKGAKSSGSSGGDAKADASAKSPEKSN